MLYFHSPLLTLKKFFHWFWHKRISYRFLSLSFLDPNFQNMKTKWTPLHAAAFQEHGKVSVVSNTNVILEFFMEAELKYHRFLQLAEYRLAVFILTVAKFNVQTADLKKNWSESYRFKKILYRLKIFEKSFQIYCLLICWFVDLLSIRLSCCC